MSSSTNLYLLRILPILFWALVGVTSWLLLIELAPKQNKWPYWDKVLHTMIFAALCALAYFAYPQKKAWMVIGLVLYGALIEWLQGVLTLTRMPSLNDWIADVAGISLTLLIATFLKRRTRLKF
ncbi:MAG: VanZ family protein [Methylophilaceae bacterium]